MENRTRMLLPLQKDLRSFLIQAKENGQLYRIRKEVDPLINIGILCSESDRAIFFEKVKGYAGWKICDGLARNRMLQALAFGTRSSQVVQEVARRLEAGPGKTRLVGGGPVKEKILKGDEVDLRNLPVCKHSGKDAGRYIGGAIGITKDPETGIQNTFMPRTWVKGKHHASFYLYSPHTGRIFMKYQKLGKPMPMALAMGVHPAIEYAANYRGRHEGYSELDLAATYLGETVELAECETMDIQVPANAEIVIEGTVHPKTRELEGPFGDFLESYCPGPTYQPVWDATALTMRKDAIFRHINATGPTDHQNLNEVTLSAQLYRQLRAEGFVVHDVHMPNFGGLILTVIQMSPRDEGDATELLRKVAAMKLFIHRWIMAVDTDVNAYDPKEILWAISARANPGRDLQIFPGSRGLSLDPLAYTSISSHGFPSIICINATKLSKGKDPKISEKFERARPTGWGSFVLRDFL